MPEDNPTEPLDWEWFGIYDNRCLPTDWKHVVSIEAGCGYDWTTFRAFWSPTARRYFWYGNSGCSCTSWGEDLHSLADFSDGDRGSLLRAVRSFAELYEYSVSMAEAFGAVEVIMRFKESPDA